MASKKKVLKAQDVFEKKEFLFSNKTTDFAKAFPTIKSVIVNVTEYDYGDFVSEKNYSNDRFGEYIKCGNPKCYNGGFQVSELIREMSYKKETTEEFELECQGYEGSPKGRRKYANCDHTFKVKIEIVYHD